MKINVQNLQVVLKIVERCNINCTYCYYFNGSNDDYKFNPPYISEQTYTEVVDFLVRGCKEQNLQSLDVILHGGEPLMLKRHIFDKMCALFNEKLSHLTKFSLFLQTNGMLINDEWIDLFGKHNVSVGVSLDGPKVYNDIYRVDKSGKGTYDKAVNGLRMLQHAYNQKRIAQMPSVISVINPDFSGKEMYRHFVDNLSVLSLNFLLPDFSHDEFARNIAKNNKYAKDYANFLMEVFDEWVKDDNTDIEIDAIKSFIDKLIKNKSYHLNRTEMSNEMTSLVITIKSNGKIGLDDTFHSISSMNYFNYNVGSISLTDLLLTAPMQDFFKLFLLIPDECLGCEWEGICRGGEFVHRYSEKKGFANKSVYCDVNIMMFTTLKQYLTSNKIISA